MKPIDTGGSAFPIPHSSEPGAYFPEPGMTLRDWFAGQALVGILSGPSSRPGVPISEWFDAPPIAYQLADAMLSARSPKQEG